MTSYTVTFPSAGSYTLYARVRANGPDSNSQNSSDSFFVPTAIGASTYLKVDEFQSTTPDVTPQYHWVNLVTEMGLEFGGQVDVEDSTATDTLLAQYTVSAGAQTFIIGRREQVFRIDAFVFDTDNTLTAAQLNTIAQIPEPSAFVLGALGLLGLAIRKRQ